VSADAARAHPFGDRGDGLPPGTAGWIADRSPARGFRSAGAPASAATATASSAATSTATSASTTPTAPSAASAASASAAATATTAATASTPAPATSAASTAPPAASIATSAAAGAGTGSTSAVATGYPERAGARHYNGRYVNVPDGRLELVIARRRHSAGWWISKRLSGGNLGRPGVQLGRRRRVSRAIRSSRQLPSSAKAL
jgi:hypothetical protein